jgi:hypothetical protein
VSATVLSKPEAGRIVKCDSENPYPREWQVLYWNAIRETNRCAIERELSDAEDAIVGRTRELLQDTGSAVEDERDALGDAMYVLGALRVALEQNTHAPEKRARQMGATRSVGENLCCSSVDGAFGS